MDHHVDASTDNDYIDLYKIIKVIAQGWRSIVILSGLLAIAVFLLTWLQPLSFQASAMIISRYERPMLTLSEEFSTIRDARYSYDNKTKAFVSIAQSPMLTQQVLEKMGDRLGDNMSMSTLRSSVEIRLQGDSIVVQATHSNPQMAADIANAWAEQAVEAINLAYSSGLALEKVDAQIDNARIDYERAQSTLEAYVRQNPMGALQLAVQEQSAILKQLHASWIDIVEQSLNAQLTWPQEQAKSYFATVVSQNALVFDEQVQAQAEMLQFYHERKTHIEEAIVRLMALRQSLDNGGESIPGSAGDALSLFLATVSLGGQHEVVTLDTSIAEIASWRDDPASYVADMDRIIEQLQSDVAQAENKIQELSAAMLQGDSYQGLGQALDESHPLYQAGLASLETLMMLDLSTPLAADYAETPLYAQIQETTSVIQGLEAELEKEEAKKSDLTKERDLTRQVYEALLERDAEVKTASEAAQEVSLASRAVTPTQAMTRKTLLKTVAAGAIGAIVACAWVLLRKAWKREAERRAADVG